MAARVTRQDLAKISLDVAFRVTPVRRTARARWAPVDGPAPT
jgi:hypothetical protein